MPRINTASILAAGAALVVISCSSATPAPADLLLRARVLLPDGAEAPAIAIRDGLVVALETVQATRVVDLGDAVVVPAFVDHHAHLLNIGMSLLNRERGETLYLDLAGLDQEAVAARVGQRASGTAPGGWILGKGWSQGAWGSGALPDRAPLDAAAPAHPAFLTRAGGHSGWANAAALAAAGIDAATPDPYGGAIRRRPDGSPSGVLLERAAEPVLRRLPPFDAATLQEAFRAGTEALAAQGVVEVFDAGFLAPPGIVDLGRDLESDLELLVAQDAASPLPLRVHLMVPAPTQLAERVLADPAAYRGLSPRLGVTHLKLFGDGALGNRGGSLTHPYADDATTSGVARMSAGEIYEWSARALDAGLDVATHAIGDATVERTLDAYERLLAERPDLQPRRLRIEHFSYSSAAAMQRAARLGVVLSVQPNFVYPDDAGHAMEDDRLGGGAMRAYPWASLLAAGATLAFGSDYFTFPAEPLMTLYAAVTRANPQGHPVDGWHPGERLDRDTALAIMTTAVVPGGDLRRGTLQPGQLADLAILSIDPRTSTASELLTAMVLATIESGRVVHGAAWLQEPR